MCAAPSPLVVAVFLNRLGILNFYFDPFSLL